jgi:hypothetical protein
VDSLWNKSQHKNNRKEQTVKKLTLTLISCLAGAFVLAQTTTVELPNPIQLPAVTNITVTGLSASTTQDGAFVVSCRQQTEAISVSTNGVRIFVRPMTVVVRVEVSAADQIPALQTVAPGTYDSLTTSNFMSTAITLLHRDAAVRLAALQKADAVIQSTLP